ncbi:MAG: adenylate/guanylate cyclase domain-containing protein [Henriciella sp.]
MFDGESDSNEWTGGDDRRLASVLVADICGFSSLAERDEDTALAVVRRVGSLLNEIAGRFEGRNFHEAGDGFFFEFASANRSMKAAREMLVAIAKDEALKRLASVKIRIGMHLGDVQVEPDGNLMGHGVNVAARLQQNADPGSILASKSLVDALSEKPGQMWSRRRLSLKNMKTPIVAFNIRDDRTIGVLLRDLWSSRRWSILSGAAAAAAILFVVMQTIFAVPDESAGPIDREAVRASLAPLIEAGRPIDDMVSALMRKDDFEDATLALQQEYEQNKEALSRAQSLDLLHQIAAISVNRDVSVAEQIYAEILKLDPYDAEALYQMAKIYRKRDFESLAQSSLLKALEGADISARQRLRVQIALIELNQDVSTLDDDVQNLSELAGEASQRGYDDVAQMARYNSIREQFMRGAGAVQSEQEASAFFEPLIEQTQTLVEEQTNAGYLYEVSESLLTLSTMQNRIGAFQSSLQTLERALEIETTLRRPARRMAIHANLAYLKVAWSETSPEGDAELLVQAEQHVAAVRDLADREGLTSREYYNWYILALIESQRENNALSCSHFEKAVQAWPEKYAAGMDVEEMANDLNCVL